MRRNGCGAETTRSPTSTRPGISANRAAVPLYDMTVYGLHAMTGILGPAKAVTAFSGVRVKEREFYGQMLPTDMDDNTLMVLDFGDNLFAFVYGVAAGGLPGMDRPLIFGTKGVINGGLLNGEPFDYPGREIDEAYGTQTALPHAVGAHRGYGRGARLRGCDAVGQLDSRGYSDYVDRGTCAVTSSRSSTPRTVRRSRGRRSS